MKTKLFILLTLLYNSQVINCQIKNIEYEVFYNTDIPHTTVANLYFDEVKDISIYIKENAKKNYIAKKNEKDNSVSVFLKSKKRFLNFYDFC